MPLPLGFPGSEDDPFAAAAARTRQGVRPEGGRQEGLGTFLAEQFPRHVLEGLLSLPQRATQAAGELQRQGDVYDPGPALEAATMTMGATPFGAPRGAIGAGPIKAYHGSPHDFERFDLSKIGTGEGAQAYGHGLYFAENPAVAQSYKISNAPTYQNTHIANLAYEAQRAAEAATGLRGIDAKPAALKWLQDEAERATPYQRQNFHDAMNNYDAVMSPPKGKMYEVNIHAAPEQFLDWDKALSQQPQNVAETLKSMGLYPRQTSTGAHYDPAGSVAYDALKVPRTSSGNDVAATNMLREAGIPGIKYLDQQSRSMANWGAPTQPLKTSNYVLFRDDIIDILRKYGLAGLAPAAGAAATVGQEAPLPMSIPQSQ